MKNLTEQPAWLALCQHYQDISAKHMRNSFADEANRFDRYSIKHGEFLLDYSRNRIDDTTMRLLFDFAESVNNETDVSLDPATVSLINHFKKLKCSS
jgi:glucose-6-phosphate isomerase